MPTQEKIELAHEISNALRRFRGRGIDVEAMLTREDYARDILQQCRVSGSDELKLLATRFTEPGAARPPHVAARPGASPPTRAEPSSQRNRSWLAPLDVFSRRSSVPRG